jgi:hypothetical protein
VGPETGEAKMDGDLCCLPCALEAAELQKDMAVQSIWDSSLPGHLHKYFVRPA